MLRMRARDFLLSQRVVKFNEMKDHPASKKFLFDPQLAIIKSWQEHGVSETRWKRCGSRGTILIKDHWKWPTEASTRRVFATRKCLISQE